MMDGRAGVTDKCDSDLNEKIKVSKMKVHTDKIEKSFSLVLDLNYYIHKYK